MDGVCGTTVDARFRDIASRFAERPALEDCGSITYRDLDRRSDEWAAWLTTAPTVVGICLRQPTEAITAMLGVIKAGRAYTLIDHDAPLQRKLAIVEEMAIELVVCDAPRGSWAGYDGLWLDPAAPCLSPLGCNRGVLAPDANSACCIVQTSGSSGAPLGVEISHAALLNNIDNYTVFAGITADDRFTMLTSAAHFAAHSAIFGALLNGACLCAFDVRNEGLSAMADWLELSSLTVYQSPPSLFRAFCHRLEPGRRFSAMRLVRLGGEPAVFGDVQLFQRHFASDAQFINAFGISEAAGNVAFFRAAGSHAPPGSVLPVGNASSGRDIMLANSAGQPVAEGEVGEIVVRSAHLATGYHRRPDLTAKKFKVSPLDGRRELWTGDLGHITPQGYLVHDGRVDDQVKIRGYRVALGGLEAALCSLEGVQTARVLKYQRDLEGDELIAFVVPRTADVTAEGLSRQLTQGLASPVLPRVVLLDELPLNPGGKVNRRKLLELAAVGSPLPAIGPRDAMEFNIATIWKTVLKVNQIGVHQNFFDIGGNSLQAMSVIAAIEARQAMKISPKLFVDYPTIAQMSEYLRSADTSNPASALMEFHGDAPGTPFFFLHNDWKGGFYCGRLAEYLGSAHPFCAIPPYRVAEGRLVTLQEMAGAHLEEVRRRAPKGPYILGGYCTGGLVAAELARQLSAQGETIRGLLLVDPPRAYLPWRQLWPAIDRAGDVLRWNLRQKMHCMQLYGLASIVLWFKKSPAAMVASACRRLGLKSLAKSLLAEPDRPETDAETAHREDYRAYVLASRIYDFERLSLPTTIYVPQARTPPSRAWTRRIKQLFPHLSFESIPGNHLTCLTEHSRALGCRMQYTLEVLRGGARSEP